MSNGTPGSNQCAIDFTFRVLKAPTIDADAAAAGVQTRANFLVTMQGSVTTAAVVSATPSLLITVVKATPTLATSASRNVGAGTISDTATVTGVAGVATPTGTVTFSVYRPSDTTCAGPVFASSTNALAGGTATSAAFPVSQPGTYRFRAAYSGDANYNAVSAPCNAPNESVVVTRRAVADFDGNGTTDRSVYRNGAWHVHGQPTVFLGLAGDISVPADYDGNGDSAGRLQGRRLVRRGPGADVPRRRRRHPGAGRLRDGTDGAVFRDGAWYVHNQPTVFLGLAGYISVPGDYDGNGTTDRAVFRDGAWYVHNQATVYFGLAGDIPVPGDYDGNGTTDRAVFRNGAWYTQGQNTVFFGLGGDIPLPLPYAIRSRFF